MNFQNKRFEFFLACLIGYFIVFNGKIFCEGIEKGKLIKYYQKETDAPLVITERIIFNEINDDILQSWRIDPSWSYTNAAGGNVLAHGNEANASSAKLADKYLNNANDWIVTNIQDMPQTSDRVILKVFHRFQLETSYDLGKILARIIGEEWQPLRYYTGESDWYEESIDITYLAGKKVQFGFQLTSDESFAFDGWSIGSISIAVASTDPLSAVMTSLNPQNFPFIYINVAVDTFGIGHPGLSSNNFTVRENGTLQTNYFKVTPPDSGGGSRLTDIVFVMDNSGSMATEQAAVSNNVIDFVNDLSASGVDFALGLCRYGQAANGGLPIIEENGQLTRDANYFKNSIWPRNTVDGSHEPGYYAITESISSFNFRPGAQRILIIITDETPDQGYSSQNDALNMCLSNSVTLYALTTSDQYSMFEPITSATNGEYYNIYSDFSDILADIKSEVANTYVIRYSSSDPALNGIERTVDVYVNYLGNQEIVSGSYIPGAAPVINRTKNTLDLHNRAWSESTEFTIEAEITDNAVPYVQGAKLFFKNTQSTSYYYVNMVRYSGDLWRGTISANYASSPGIDYYISATDGENTVSDPSIEPSISPYQIAILPNEAPQITHTPVTSITPNTPIEISAAIFDNTNYVARAKLYYRMVGDLLFEAVNMQAANGNYQAEIPANFVTIDGVEYYIKARDDFNVSSSSGTADDPHIIVDSSSEIEGALSADLAGPTELQLVDNQYTPNPFTASVNVSYSTDATAPIEDFRLISKLGPGLRWPEGETSIKFMGTIYPGETRQASWRVKPTDTYAGDSWYGVEITSKTTQLLYVERELYIPPNLTFPPPEIIYPPDSSSNITINPTTFLWHSVEGSQWYNFKLSTAEANGAVFFFKSGLTDTTISVDGLELYKKYYWQLQATDIGINGDLTLWNEFTTGTGEIDPPQLTDPIANKAGVGSSAWFNWSAVSGVTSYNVQIDNNWDFSSPFIDSINVNDTRFFVENMQYSHTYYWRVRSKNASIVSDWPESRQFKTMAVPQVHINYPNDYVLYYLDEGDQYFIDREYTIESIPDQYKDLLWLKTGGDEKHNTDSDFLSIRLDRPSTIYIGYDHRGTNPPDWLISQFIFTGDTIGVSDIYGTPYNIWRGDFSAGTHILGGNWAGRETGARITYCVFFEATSMLSISGHVDYYLSKNPVPSTKMELLSDSSKPMTDGDGLYIIDNISPSINYVVTPSKAMEQDQDDLTITSQDAYEAAQLAMGNSTSSSYQSIIADVDGDGRILMWDASLIARYSAGIQLPDSINIGEWAFDPPERIYPNLQQSYENQDYTALVIGDADGSWQMPTNLAKAEKLQTLAYFQDNQKIRIPIALTLANPLESFDLTVRYDPDHLLYSNAIMSKEYFHVFENKCNGQVRLASFRNSKGDNDKPEFIFLEFKRKGSDTKLTDVVIDRFLINGRRQNNRIANINLKSGRAKPSRFSIYQNYPNPFNPQTTIRFDLPWDKAETTTLKIFDITGKLVKILCNDQLSAGSYNYIWDAKEENGNELPSGLYICQLKSGAENKTIKLIKTK